MSNLEEFKRKAALSLFGMTVEQAHDKKICINCKKDAWSIIHTDFDMAEWRISALCPVCFDAITRRG